MKCCDMDAGKLRSLITIEKKTRTPDGMGGTVDTWTADPVGGVWAAIEAMSGERRWSFSYTEAGREMTRNKFLMTIRFRGDAEGAPYYTAENRIVYRGRTYAIDAVLDMEDRQEWLEIATTQSSPS